MHNNNSNNKVDSAEDKVLRLKQAYSRVLATDSGKLVFEDLLKFSQVDNLCKGQDVNDTYFMLGKRAVGLRIKKQGVE